MRAWGAACPYDRSADVTVSGNTRCRTLSSECGRVQVVGAASVGVAVIPPCQWRSLKFATPAAVCRVSSLRRRVAAVAVRRNKRIRGRRSLVDYDGRVDNAARMCVVGEPSGRSRAPSRRWRRAFGVKMSVAPSLNEQLRRGHYPGPARSARPPKGAATLSTWRLDFPPPNTGVNRQGLHCRHLLRRQCRCV